MSKPLKQKTKSVKLVKENEYSQGWKNGQRKLAYCIMEMPMEGLDDYRYILEHLKKVADGEEYIDNPYMGFISYKLK